MRDCTVDQPWDGSLEDNLQVTHIDVIQSTHMLEFKGYQGYVTARVIVYTCRNCGRTWEKVI